MLVVVIMIQCDTMRDTCRILCHCWVSAAPCTVSNFFRLTASKTNSEFLLRSIYFKLEHDILYDGRFLTFLYSRGIWASWYHILVSCWSSKKSFGIVSQARKSDGPFFQFVLHSQQWSRCKHDLVDGLSTSTWERLCKGVQEFRWKPDAYRVLIF